MGVVDIEDVASAHILAMESPNASGNRFVCSAQTITFEQICQVLKKKFPAYPVPSEVETTPNPSGGYITCGFPPKFSSEKIKKELGMVFKPIEDTLEVAANALIEGKFIDKL